MGALEIVGLEWLGALGLFLGFILLIRYLSHRERMAMIDRGLIPPQAVWKRAMARPVSASLRGGLITGMVGLAVTFGLYTLGYVLPPPFSAVPGKIGPWLLPGLIPLGIGAALVASHYLGPPRPAEDATQEESASSPSGTSHVRRLLDWRPLGRATPAPDEPHDDTQDEVSAGG